MSFISDDGAEELNSLGVQIYCYSTRSFALDERQTDAAWRQKIARSCESGLVRDVSSLSPHNVAEIINEAGNHVAIVPDGWTMSTRPLECMRDKPALLHVNFLGFPGSTGTEFMDFTVSDAIVTPPEYSTSFTEKILFHPVMYHPFPYRELYTAALNPLSREDPERSYFKFSRSDVGLSEEDVVFASFNNLLKLDAEVIRIWDEVTAQNESYRFWMLRWKRRHGFDRSLNMLEHLGKRAHASDVFPFVDHLQYKTLADVFVDSFIYSGHMTVAEAAFIGLPVITTSGERFTQRVASSILLNLERLVPSCEIGFVARSAEQYMRALRQMLERHSRVVASTRRRNRFRCSQKVQNASFFDIKSWVKEFSKSLQLAVDAALCSNANHQSAKKNIITKASSTNSG